MQSFVSPAAIPALPATIEAQLEDLYVRGTPQNTLRAYERDLMYITAWKQTAFNSDLDWPERPDVALRFVLDHARNLEEDPLTDPARETAEALIEAGLRKSLACPAPSCFTGCAILKARFPRPCSFKPGVRPGARRPSPQSRNHRTQSPARCWVS